MQSFEGNSNTPGHVRLRPTQPGHAWLNLMLGNIQNGMLESKPSPWRSVLVVSNLALGLYLWPKPQAGLGITKTTSAVNRSTLNKHK